MDSSEFQVVGKEMVDYMVNYMDTISSRRVVSSVEPGYLAPMLPYEPPMEPEPWSDVMKDIESKIMPGITHWQHPRFHAYFPSGNGYPSILGDMLSDIIGCIGFSWAASPACTELETVMLDWLGRAIGLPSQFLFSEPGSTGGGTLQGSASDAIFAVMLSARHNAIKYLQAEDKNPTAEPSEYLPKLVAYCSKQAHSCVEKAAKLALVRLRILEPDENESLRGETLQKAIDADLQQGLMPFFVSATLGTTGCCSFDNLIELGEITQKLPHCWFHADGAYGGSSFLCPELRGPMAGIELVDSFNLNCNKWMLITFDCSCLWVKDTYKFTSAMIVDPIYLKHENMNLTIDYRHWGVSLSRRFRSLKLWFTFRLYGIRGLQEYIRNHVRLARLFEEKVRKDSRFEVLNEVKLALVCFRLRGTDKLNQQLLASINGSGELHMIPSVIKGKYIIRFCVVYQHATADDIDVAWDIIKKHAVRILEESAVQERRPSKLSRRFSFTRSVSHDEFQRRTSRNSLRDLATPIVVPEDEDDLEGNNVDDVFKAPSSERPNFNASV